MLSFLVISGFLVACNSDHGLIRHSGDTDPQYADTVPPTDPCFHDGHDPADLGYTETLPDGDVLAFSWDEPIVIQVIVNAPDESSVTFSGIGIDVFAEPPDDTALPESLGSTGTYAGNAATSVLRGSAGAYTLSHATDLHLEGDQNWVHYGWQQGDVSQNTADWEPNIAPWTIGVGGMDVVELDFPELSAVLPDGYTCAEFHLATPYDHGHHVSLLKE